MKEFSPIITIHGNKELYIENFKKINTLIVCKIRKKLLTLHT